MQGIRVKCMITLSKLLAVWKKYIVQENVNMDKNLNEDYLYLYSETQLLKKENEMMRDSSKFTLCITLITGEFRTPQ